MTDSLVGALWDAVARLAREEELERRVRLRRQQEREANSRNYVLVYEPKTPLTAVWAEHDLECEGL